MKRLVVNGLAGTCLFAMLVLPAVAAGLRVEDARTAPPLPGTDMMAGYLTVVNESEDTVTIRGAHSPAFGRISLHRSVEEHGQSHMEPVEQLTLDSGERVVFEPGGLHLMMFHPAGQPQVGDTLELELQTDAGSVAASMRVIERSKLLLP